MIIRGNRQRGTYYRYNFVLSEIPLFMIVRISALGIYKAYINGQELDEQVFLPGRTSYSYRVQYQQYEVTDKLQKGNNTLAIVLANGWYKKVPKLFAGLYDMDDKEVQQEKLVKGIWKAYTQGPLQFNDMKLGEIYDARKEMRQWTLPQYDDASWDKVKETKFEGELIPHEGEKILEQEHFLPKEILYTPNGDTVIDFGQNIAGYMKFTVTGTMGTTVKMVYGETLDQNGNFTQSNLTFSKSNKTGNYPQTIQYTLKEGKQSYKPQASVHGFRYVKLENWPEEARKDNFEALAVYSNLKRTGSFTCSNTEINQLLDNIRWSAKGNFLDIPTDCPTRERAGWTGDAMVYCEAATYQMDTRKFYRKWLKDVILEQREDGRIRNIVPDGGMPSFMDGAAGWSDVIVKLPWIMYQFYDDSDILKMAYPAIKKHVSFMEHRAQKRKWWNYKEKEYSKYLIDCGFHWGEWLEPGTNMPELALKGFLSPDMEVASAYYAWSVGKVAEIAELLGEKEDAKKYAAQYTAIRNAYRKKFLPNGKLESARQCKYVRPIALHLVEENAGVPMAEKLNEMVIKNNYCIGTGFLSTPHILNVLTDYGYAATAYKMIENRKMPGWLYEVEKGATTIWENWCGIDENNVPRNSLNHYSPGAIVSWFYSRCAGIRPLRPGFQKVLIQPIPGGNLQWICCSYDSVGGKIKVHWEHINRMFRLNVETPAPTVVRLPDGEQYEVEKGEHSFECVLS